MQCPFCDRENTEDATFCSGCGQRLAHVCPSCNRSNVPDSSFCSGCGQSLEPAAVTPSVAAAAPVTPASPSPAAMPTSFASGRYQVKRFLGEGAKKRVYLARDTRLDRDVAIALIKTEGLDLDTRVRVRREAQAMGRLGDNPHVVTVHDIDEEDDQLYIVSQYMSGGDLEGRLRDAVDHRLPLDEALRVGDQLCQALEHAHERKVIHRDLKPGNVWLSEEGTAQLGDFGLALSLDRSRLTQEGMMVGTAAYMSPEQAVSGAVTERSDLYALGAMLYEMLTGRPPFLGDDLVAVISQHINTAPVAPSWHNPEIPRGLETLILRLLAKDPTERPESARAVREAIQHARTMPAEVLSPSQESEANPLARLASGVFVGREPELERLRAAFEDALSGRGHVLMLVGESGIGKTRIAEELATYATMRGAQALWGRCYEGEGAPAYWPWIQIIRAYVHDQEPKSLASEMGPGAADIAEVVSEVRELLPGLPAAPELDPDEARFRLFDSITTFFRTASNRQPVVLLLDDLNWADKASLLLLQFLARDLGSARILVVGTYRDVELERNHPLAQTLAELARSHVGDHVLLQGLTESDVSRFVELTAGRPPSESLVAAVYRETEGNPFFVDEVVQLLQAEGHLDGAGDARSFSLDIPQGVRQVIGRRLSGLSAECNRVLEIASVIGREFGLSALARVSELSEDALLDLLEEAEGARIIAELPEQAETYRFSRALTRQTLYEEIRTTRRLRLHRKIAEVLESIYAGKPETHLAELAYHFCEGVSSGNVEKAVDYAVRAAEKESAVLAYEEAVSHYARALRALESADPVDESRQCDLLIALGEAQIRTAELADSRDSYRSAIDLARRLESTERFARAALGLGGVTFGGRTFDKELVALLGEALTPLGEEDSALRSRLLARLSDELLYSETPERAEAVYHEAARIARRVKDRGAMIRALTVDMPGTRDDPESDLEIADEVIALSIEAGSKHTEFQGRQARVVRLIALAEADAIASELDRASEIAEELRQPYHRGLAAAARGSRALWRGDLDEARALSWEGRDLLSRVAPEAAAQFFGVQYYTRRRYQGRLGEILGAVRAGITQFPTMPTWPSLLALACSESGREQEAREELETLAQDDFAILRYDSMYLYDLGLLADTCANLGDAERAASLYERLLSFKGCYLGISWVVTGGSAPRALARLAATLQRFDDAERHFEEALRVDVKMGARAWLARTQCDYAEMLIRRSAPGDAERALELIGQSLDTSQELKLNGWVDLGLDLKLRLQGVESGSVQSSIVVVASSFRSERPDLTLHAAQDGTVTLMFSDVEGFTPMTERLGDEAAHRIIQSHNAIVREQLAAHAGHEVELQGDGFLLAFPSPRRAVHCAIGIQRAFAAYSAEHPEQPIRVRIGLHTGQAIKDADKFFGLSVILAARIAAVASGGEIVVSSLLQEITEGEDGIRFGASREVALKGISESQRIYQVEWEA